MRRLVMSLVLASVCLSLSGCFFFDQEHNRSIIRYWKNDMMVIHEDLDWILAMEPDYPQLDPMLESYER